MLFCKRSWFGTRQQLRILFYVAFSLLSLPCRCLEQPLRWAAGTRLPSRGERHGAGSTRHSLDKALKEQLWSGNQNLVYSWGEDGFEKAQMFKVIFKILLP